MVDDIFYRANINGMNALHKGIEFDVSIRLTSKISCELLYSAGDWKLTSADTVRFLDDNNNPIVDDFGNEIIAAFNAEGVHVGDAAQTQLGFSLRYEPTTVSYVKLRYTFFDDYFAD